MNETLPVIDGLRLIARTYEFGPGEVWRARMLGGLGGAEGVRLPGELTGVGECDVRLLRLPVDPAIRARAHSVAADLVGLSDAGLVGVREVRTAYDGIALVLTPLPSPMLALSLLARRRQLSAGEVVTLGVAIAWALAAAHAAGVTHGRLRDADVLLDPGGRPMLAGVGVMGVLGAAGDPAEDVRGLSRMLLSLLDAQTSGAGKVAAALQQAALDPAALASTLAAACPAAPIRLGEGSADSSAPSRPLVREHRSGRARRSISGGLLAGAFGGVHWRRAARFAGIGAVIVALAGVIGWMSAPGPAASAAPGSRAPVTSWPGVLTALDSSRSQAFAAPGSIESSAFDAAGSQALRYDTAAVASLQSQGAHATGLRMELVAVSVQHQTPGEVTLVVTDSRSAYVIRGMQQQVLSRVAARPQARHLIVLTSAGAGVWRIAKVTTD